MDTQKIAKRWVGMILLVFSFGLLPGVLPPTEPNIELMELAERSLRSESGVVPAKSEIETRYHGFMDEQWRNWLENVLLLAFSLVAVVLAVLSKARLGLWAVLALCAVMLLIYVPPLVRLSEHGFIKFATIVLNSTAKREILDHVVVLWHILIAPFAYACLALGAVVLLIRQRAPSEVKL